MKQYSEISCAAPTDMIRKIWLRRKVSRSSEVRATPAVAQEALAAVQINSDAVNYAEALAAEILFHILDSRLTFSGSVG